MSDIKRVIIQLKRPSSHDRHGRTTEGRYIVEDGTVKLVDLEGKLVSDAEGNTYTHVLQPKDHAHSIAGALTREFHNKLRGGDKQGWWGPINYPRDGSIA
jgi:hypothetical protein